MKKLFLLIATFLIFQIKSSTPVDFLTQVYTQIDKDKYQDVKELLTKNTDSLTVKNINQLIEILKNKKTLHENVVKQSTSLADLSKTTISTVSLSAIALASLFIKAQSIGTLLDLHDENYVSPIIISIAEKLCDNDIDWTRINTKILALLSIGISTNATYFSGKKLFDIIFNNKKTKTKKLIEEIMILETYLRNQLLILNQ